MEITANAKESPLVFPDASLMMLVITTLTQPTMMARATTQGILAMMGTAQQPMTHTIQTAIVLENPRGLLDAPIAGRVTTTLMQPTMMDRATTPEVPAMMGTAQQPMTHTTPTAIASEIHQLILGVL